MPDFINRENEIFGILQKFIDARLEFVVIGGYAVSAYKHRFSTDADVVIKSADEETFSTVLEKSKFAKAVTKELDNVYSTKFVRFQKRTELPVSVDLLVGGMGIRQTGGAMSYETLKNNSELKTVKGMQKEVVLPVPKREVLIAMKLHAGRGTDLRDVAALSKNLNIELIQKLIVMGDTKPVKQSVDKLISLLEDKGFMDSFKGVFMEKKYDLDIEEVRKLRKLKL